MRDCDDRERNDKPSELIESYLSVYRNGKWVDQVRLISVSRVGRDSDNHISLPDRQVSRHHCVVRWSDGCWEVADLNSSNGTKLNGRKISSAHKLNPGDTIGVGRYELGFVLESDSRRQAPMSYGTHPKGNVGPASPAPRVVERVRIAGLFKESEIAALDDSVPGGYAALYRLAVRAASIQDQSILANVSLQQIVNAVHADCGAIVLTSASDSDSDEQNHQCVSVVSKGDDRFDPSQGVSDLVLEDGEAILAVELGAERGRFDSVDAIGAESMMCVPIRVEGEILGLIHIYRRDPSRMFTKRDLEWCLAAADLMGIALQRIEELMRLTMNLDTAVSDVRSDIEQIVGESAPVVQLRQTIEMAAKSDSTVLIYGPSGSGKSLVAQHIHAASTRSNAPIVRINCAGLSQALYEQHMCGSESSDQPSIVSQSEGGALYLDNISELSQDLQNQLADCLDDQSCVGNMRVYASSILSPEELASSDFSERLLHRLRVLEVVVPSLQNRLSDIPALVDYFVEKSTKDESPAIPPGVLEPLLSREWPGNVRQLHNCVRKALAFSQNGTLDFSDMPTVRESESEYFRAKSRQKLQEVEKGYIQHVLHHAQGNKSEASNILGISRSTLDRKIGRYQQDSDVNEQ